MLADARVYRLPLRGSPCLQLVKTSLRHSSLRGYVLPPTVALCVFEVMTGRSLRPHRVAQQQNFRGALPRYSVES